MFGSYRENRGYTTQDQEVEIERSRKRGNKMSPRHTMEFHINEPGSGIQKRNRRSTSPQSLSAPKNVHRKRSSVEQDSIGPSNQTTVQEYSGQYYLNIAAITEEENKNLKEQNLYLTKEIKKMQEREKRMKQMVEKTKKYKQLYQETVLELEVANQECQANQKALEQMKKIAEIGIYQLESKMENYHSEDSIPYQSPYSDKRNPHPYNLQPK